MRNGSLHQAALILLLLAACSGEGASNPEAAGQGIAVGVVPPAARVGAKESVAFAATVTGSANTLVTWTVQEGSAGGAIDGGGRYTAPSTNGTYHVVAVSAADPTKSATATVTVAGQPPPASGAPMTTASRTSGAAPLAVFFDAVDTLNEGVSYPYAWSSGVTQPTDMEGASFAWDFGDPSAGVWSVTGRGKNTTTGYTAAHVYETPGTYTATLTVTQTTGRVDTYKQTIVVSAFGGTTGYASASGTAAAPGTEAAPTSLSSGWAWLNGGSSRRLLLKRGDTFSAGSLTVTTGRTDNILGAYGSGNRPILNGNILARDQRWTFMDLDLVGTGGNGLELGADRDCSNVLILRVRTTGYSMGFETDIVAARYQATPPNLNDGVMLVESEVNVAGNMAIYLGGRRIAVMGSDSHGGGSHDLRVWQANKGVVSNNRLWGTSGTGHYQHALKLHSHMAERPGLPESRWISITDNVAMYEAPWVFSIGPQNAQNDERVSHVVLERNRTYGGSGGYTQAGFEISARQVLMRNNVLDGTGGDPSFAGALVQQRGVEPAPVDIRFLNNTVAVRAAVSDFAGIKLGAGVTNVTVRNNLAWTPSGSGRGMVGGSVPTLTESNDLVTSGNAVFTNSAGEDYSLPVGSPAVDAGAALPEVRTDFNGASRPAGAGYDLGAFESR